MPAYEAGETIGEAAESVLSQTVGDLELLVVDDGSSVPVHDALGGLLGDPRVRLIRHPCNRGTSAARNTALAAARAPLVSQLDADDLWEPGYLEAVLPCFDDPGVGLAYSNATILDHPGGHDDYIGDPSVHPMDRFPKIAERNPIPCPTATMRTQAVLSVGGYAPWLRMCEDYYLYMRLARSGWRFAYVHRRLACYRWPQSDRGMSYDRRRHELWELAMFGSFVARHPRTPGPRRQVRTRVRRELDQAHEIAQRRRLPRVPGGRPRILVEPGSHHVLNLGDIAMLQVCIERLRRLFPGAAIDVITASPERLARHCPGTRPVPAQGRYAWFEAVGGGGPYASLLSRRARTRLARLGGSLAGLSPRAARAVLRTELLAREPVDADVHRFVEALLGADAFVLSGRSGITDAFLGDGIQVLELCRAARRLGVPTAMLGQGVGPVEDARLRAQASAVLPGVDLISVRERHSAPRLLGALGVAPDRVAVTGDDAIEAATRLRPDRPSPSGIGVGLRVSPYAEVGEPALAALRDALHAAAATHAGELLPIPVSLHPGEADADTLRRLVGRDGAELETPRAVIERAGRCRVVVTGSYHAGVFALAQGVPVVALAGSSYYRAKLEGLADMFAGGCTVLPLEAEDLRERLGAAVGTAWNEAEAIRPALLAAADRQVAAGRAAYARLGALVSATAAGRGGAPAG